VDWGPASIAGERGPARREFVREGVVKDHPPYVGSAGEEMEASGGRTGREGEVLRFLLEEEFVGERESLRAESILFLVESLEPTEWMGEEEPLLLRTFEDDDRGVAEKDCSKGLGSRSKSERVCRVRGRLSGGGEGDEDMV
jgi:hypothetical protein